MSLTTGSSSFGILDETAGGKTALSPFIPPDLMSKLVLLHHIEQHYVM